MTHRDIEGLAHRSIERREGGKGGGLHGRVRACVRERRFLRAWFRVQSFLFIFMRQDRLGAAATAAAVPCLLGGAYATMWGGNRPLASLLGLGFHQCVLPSILQPRAASSNTRKFQNKKKIKTRRGGRAQQKKTGGQRRKKKRKEHKNKRDKRRKKPRAESGCPLLFFACCLLAFLHCFPSRRLISRWRGDWFCCCCGSFSLCVSAPAVAAALPSSTRCLSAWGWSGVCVCVILSSNYHNYHPLLPRASFNWPCSSLLSFPLPAAATCCRCFLSLSSLSVAARPRLLPS